MVNADKIKLIAADLDNTVLPAGEKHVSRRLSEDLRKAEKRGIHFLLNTGRHYTFLQPSLFDELPLSLIGTINGACLVDKEGKTIEKHPMREADMNAITDLSIRNHIGLGFKFEDAVVTYANYDRFIEGYCGNDEFRRSKVLDDDEKRDHHLKHGLPLGTFLIGDESIIDLYKESIPELVFAWSQHDGYDVFLKNINKSTAVEPVLKMLGIGWENVISFGDAGNDTPFIEKAGIGVAMGNSKDDVKEHADIIAEESKNDGVAITLEELGLC